MVPFEQLIFDAAASNGSRDFYFMDISGQKMLNNHQIVFDRCNRTYASGGTTVPAE